MSIIKNTPNFLRQSGFSFTTTLNKTIDIITDPAALGIYVYLASKPPRWQIVEKHLREHFKKGEDFIHERLMYLKKLGLLEKIPVKNEKGQIEHWETVLYAESQLIENSDESIEVEPENPPKYSQEAAPLLDHLPEKPPSGKTTLWKNHLVENTPPFINKRDLKIKNTTKPPIVPQGDDECLNAFCLFWTLYPVKAAKAVCLKYWTKNKLHKVADEIMAKIKLQIAHDDRFLRGFIRNPAKYLREEGWKDDIFPEKGHSFQANKDTRSMNGQHLTY